MSGSLMDEVELVFFPESGYEQDRTFLSQWLIIYDLLSVLINREINTFTKKLNDNLKHVDRIETSSVAWHSDTSSELRNESRLMISQVNPGLKRITSQVGRSIVGIVVGVTNQLPRSSIRLPTSLLRFLFLFFFYNELFIRICVVAPFSSGPFMLNILNAGRVILLISFFYRRSFRRW